jgi:hypothetical protein
LGISLGLNEIFIFFFTFNLGGLFGLLFSLLLLGIFLLNFFLDFFLSLGDSGFKFRNMILGTRENILEFFLLVTLSLFHEFFNLFDMSFVLFKSVLGFTYMSAQFLNLCGSRSSLGQVSCESNEVKVWDLLWFSQSIDGRTVHGSNLLLVFICLFIKLSLIELESLNVSE